MLKQRVITALIMAAVLIAVLIFLPLPAQALIFGLLVAAGAWEWSRLAGWESPLARSAYLLLLLGLMAGLYYHVGLLTGIAQQEQVQSVVGLACLWWSFALLWVKAYPASAVIWRHPIMRSLMGVLILPLAWLAAVYLLSLPRGGALVVVMVLITASADIGAYFAGRAFGQHKLAPAVSPAKTWEGFWGGVAACLLLALVLWYLLPLYLEHLDFSAVAAVVVITGLASVVGDLTVSMVKRESGVKDSGSLLPGHGGILDRLDSLCAAAPVFALGLILAGW